MAAFQIIEYILQVLFLDFVNIVVRHGHQPSSFRTQLALAGAQNFINFIPQPAELYSLALAWVVSLQADVVSEPSFNPLVSDVPAISNIPQPYDDEVNPASDLGLYIAIVAVLLGFVGGMYLVGVRCSSPRQPEQPAKELVVLVDDYVTETAVPVVASPSCSSQPCTLLVASNPSPSSSCPPSNSSSSPESYPSIMADLFACRLRNPEASRAGSSAAALERHRRLTQALDGLRAVHRGWYALSRCARFAIVWHLISNVRFCVATGFVDSCGHLAYPMAVVRSRVDAAVADCALAGFEQLMAAYWEFTDVEQDAILRHLLNGAPSIAAVGQDTSQSTAPQAEKQQHRDAKHQQRQRIPLRDIGKQPGMKMTPLAETTKHGGGDDENAPPQPFCSRVDKGKCRAP
ncbi:hypothetical protein FB45DRAFT_931593 [Roridomyces roridus]|uniref:Uncharacterized protein n=1 Tax=Roridomyces roridus TaxID=1738132 RepID=A0AAD7BEK8_9AGAR|nr:hypothetical protein FB45DRAFT_931593 [Roridomyces roridus]